MARKIASETERRRRVQLGYLASGNNGISNTTKRFGGTRTEEIAGGSPKARAAKNALNKGAGRTASKKRAAAGLQADTAAMQRNRRGGYGSSDSRFAGTRTEKFGIREAARNASKRGTYKRLKQPKKAKMPKIEKKSDVSPYQPRTFARESKKAMGDRIEQEKAGGVRRRIQNR